MSYPVNKIFLLFAFTVFLDYRLYAQTISSSLYSVSGLSKTTTKNLYECADLKLKLDLDEFQYKQIVKIKIDYRNRILGTIQKYNNESSRYRIQLYIAMAMIDHDIRIGGLLDKKQRKIWYDLQHNQRRITYLKLLKRKTCEANLTDLN